MQFSLKGKVDFRFNENYVEKKKYELFFRTSCVAYSSCVKTNKMSCPYGAYGQHHSTNVFGRYVEPTYSFGCFFYYQKHIHFSIYPFSFLVILVGSTEQGDVWRWYCRPSSRKRRQDCNQGHKSLSFTIPPYPVLSFTLKCHLATPPRRLSALPVLYLMQPLLVVYFLKKKRNRVAAGI